MWPLRKQKQRLADAGSARFFEQNSQHWFEPFIPTLLTELFLIWSHPTGYLYPMARSFRRPRALAVLWPWKWCFRLTVLVKPVGFPNELGHLGMWRSPSMSRCMNQLCMLMSPCPLIPCFGMMYPASGLPKLGPLNKSQLERPALFLPFQVGSLVKWLVLLGEGRGLQQS